MKSLKATALAACLSITVSAPSWAAGDYVLRMTPGEKRETLAQQKDPAVAAILGVIPGVGHVYAGNWQRGAVIGGSALALIIALVALNAVAGQTTPVNNDPNGIASALSLLGFAIFDAWNVRDAFYTTVAINQSLEEKARGVKLPPPTEF